MEVLLYKVDTNNVMQSERFGLVTIVTEGLSSLSIRWGKKFRSSPCIISVLTTLR